MQKFIPNDFTNFVEGYLIGVAFTSRRDFDDDRNSFENVRAGDITNFVKPADVAARIGVDGMARICVDCIKFVEANEGDLWMLFADDMDRAGQSFHFSRNGHGIDFQSDDYGGRAVSEAFEALNKSAASFGECELIGKMLV